MHSKKHNPERIEPPGGSVDIGETAEQCALREAKEELDKFSSFDWYSYEELLDFKNNGSLAPNLIQCLDQLIDLMN